MELAEEVIPLAQVAPEWVIPEQPRDLPSGEAVIVVEIDGRRHRRAVALVDGMSVSSTFVRVQDERQGSVNEAALG